MAEGADGGFRETAEWDWVDTASGERLHHLAEITDSDDTVSLVWGATGRTTCGIRSVFFIPGLMSRMSAPRCAKCCDKLGYPRGIGSPKNDNALRPLVQARLASLEAFGQ